MKYKTGGVNIVDCSYDFEFLMLLKPNCQSFQMPKLTPVQFAGDQS